MSGPDQWEHDRQGCRLQGRLGESGAASEPHARWRSLGPGRAGLLVGGDASRTTHWLSPSAASLAAATAVGTRGPSCCWGCCLTPPLSLLFPATPPQWSGRSSCLIFLQDNDSLYLSLFSLLKLTLQMRVLLGTILHDLSRPSINKRQIMIQALGG